MTQNELDQLVIYYNSNTVVIRSCCKISRVNDTVKFLISRSTTNKRNKTLKVLKAFHMSQEA